MDAGTRLPGLHRALDLKRLVMYAGASWDWHALHYDPAHAAAIGLSAPIADGQMFGALFAEQVLSLLGPTATIEKMTLRFRSIVVAGEAVDISGEIDSVDPSAGGIRISAVHRLEAGDRLCSTGTTVTWLPQ